MQALAPEMIGEDEFEAEVTAMGAAVAEAEAAQADAGMRPRSGGKRARPEASPPKL